MPFNIRLRKITPQDESFLLSVYASTRAEEMQLVPWSDAEKAEFLQSQFQAQHTYYQQHYPQASFDVIAVADQQVGRLYVDRGAGELRIIDIALLPEFRGQGIGSQLLQDLIAESDAAGDRITIHVEKNNPALRLYRRLGFTEIEEVGIYWLMERKPAQG